MRAHARGAGQKLYETATRTVHFLLKRRMISFLL